MRLSELKGRAVVDLDEAKKIGEVDDLALETSTHQILGLIIKSGLFNHTQIIALSQVKSVGPDAITITSSAAIHSETTKSLTSALSDILNNKIVTDGGSFAGVISDVELEPTTLQITGYAYKPDGLFARSQEFPVSPLIRYGEKLVTVPEQLINPA